MGTETSRVGATPAVRKQFLPVILLLFVGSGCAALVYEIVWLQMLQLLVGSTAVSLGVLLGTFMGGMCLGSLLLPRVVSPKWHPLAVYAALELGIGAIAVLVWFLMPWLSDLYTAQFVGGQSGVLLRGLVAGICLLPPTILMGATLPAIARWVETTPKGVSWLGLFYGGNIAGAVFGCLLAGFFLLRVYDMLVATVVALVINIVVALLALGLAWMSPHRASGHEPSAQRAERTPLAWMIYLVIGLSGMAALGAEVVWTRLISLMLGGTVYTFSIILAVFLVGLGIGSSAGAIIARNSRWPAWALGTCQTLLVVSIFWTGYVVANSIPYWPIDPALATNPWHVFQLDFLRTAWAILPGACLWGASFPLALAAVSVRGQDPGRLVGGVYAANTLGAIAGALAFSVWVIPSLGTLTAQRILIGISIAAAMLALLYRVSQPRRDSETSEADLRGRVGAAVQMAGVVAIGLLLATMLAPVPWGMVAYGRHMATWRNTLVPGQREKENVVSMSAKEVQDLRDDDGRKQYGIYVGEGINVSVAVSYSRDGTQNFHGAGKVQASNQWQDMRLQRLLGHISALAVKNPENVLVVACGAGVTAGSFIVHPEVKRIVICDIEPLVPTVVTPMFGKENYHIVDNIAKENPTTVEGKQVEVVYDDGRHFVRTTNEKFDVITSDPIDPWVKGCAALNTVEYYQMCKDHLNDGGVMTLWIPLYESDEATFKSVLATFFQVFPNGVLWSNDVEGEGYDAVLFGIKDENNRGYRINVDEFQARWDRDDHARVRSSLDFVGFETATDLLATYAGHATALGEWSRDAKINTDRNLRLQYLAGMAFNRQEATNLLGGVLKYYRFPKQDLFVGSDEKLRDLEQRLFNAGRARDAAVRRPTARVAVANPSFSQKP
jgi:spermidine synthase